MICRLIGTDACSGASLVGLREIVWPEALAALVFDGANCYVLSHPCTTPSALEQTCTHAPVTTTRCAGQRFHSERVAMSEPRTLGCPCSHQLGRLRGKCGATEKDLRPSP